MSQARQATDVVPHRGPAAVTLELCHPSRLQDANRKWKKRAVLQLMLDPDPGRGAELWTVDQGAYRRIAVVVGAVTRSGISSK